MGLKLPGVPNLFPHSRRFDTGGGKVRAGAATILVAKDGSGDTDDIAEAVKLIPDDKGGSIYIKEGTYVVTSPITVAVDSIKFVGSGISTIIKTDDDINIFTIGKNNISFEGLEIKGAGTGKTNNSGIEVTWGYCTIFDCRIWNCGKAGIYLNQSSWTFITNCRIRDNPGVGILLHKDSSSATRNIITANWFLTNNEGAIVIGEVCKWNIFNGNLFGNNGNGAGGTVPTIKTDGEKNIFNNNMFKSGFDEDIEFTANSEDNIFTGNMLSLAFGSAILDNGTNNEIAHNVEL